MDPDKTLRDNPGSAVFSQHAEHLAREGRIREAVDILRKGIEANPYHAPGYSVLAEILFQLDSEEEAVERLFASVRLDPQSPRDLFRLGAFYRDHEPEKAEPFLSAARVYEPGFDEAADFVSIRVSAQDRADLKDGVSTPTGDAAGPVMDSSVDDSPEVEAAPAVTGDRFPDTLEDRRNEGTELGKGEGDASDAGGMEQGEYPRPLNDRPVDSADPEDTPSLENAGWGVFDEPVVQQIEDEEHDFFDVISEYREVEKEEDLEDIFTELDQNRNPDVPVIEESEGAPDVRDITDSELGEDLDSGGATGGETEEGGGAPETPEPGNAVAPVLNIDEEEEYNLANFGFESPNEGELPVLSPEERSELLSLAGVHDESGLPREDGYGLAGLTLDDLDASPTEAGFGHDGGQPEENADAEAASGTAVPDTIFGSAGLSDGVSYFDLISAWDEPEASASAPTGDVPPEEVEPESPLVSILDVPPAEILPAEFGESGDVLHDSGETDGESMVIESQSALIPDFPEKEEPELPAASVEPSPSEVEEIPEADGQQSAAPESSGPFSQFASLDDALASYGFSIPSTETEPPAVEERPAGESLDDLISAYRNVLDTPPVLSRRPVPQEPVTPPVPSAPVKREPAPEPSPAHSAGRGSYTATMAEIYSSQGLVARAIDIYETLLAETPENERYRARLAELRRIHEQNTDVS